MEFADISQALLLGAGLAMDAASVSMTNGMLEKKMKIKKMFLIALMFGLFQGAMPLIGYFLGSIFTNVISTYVPYIGFALLCFLGAKMIYDTFKDEDEKKVDLTFFVIFIQAIATSIDALATGIIYIKEEPLFVLGVFSIVAITTFVISYFAIYLGKMFGELLNKYATFLGGIILISIGFKLLLEAYFYIYLIALGVLALTSFIAIALIKNHTNSMKYYALLKELNTYKPIDEKEENDLIALINLLKDKKYKGFDRNNEDIHITSSAIVLNETKDKVLFCYHNIYNSWSWLGGHADKEIDLKRVAIKEVKEESGLENFTLLSEKICSIEILPVKEHMKNNKLVKEHKHANVTYVFVASENEELKINEKENSAVKFLEISALDNLVEEKHMLKIYKKIINKITKEKIAC